MPLNLLFTEKRVNLDTVEIMSFYLDTRPLTEYLSDDILTRWFIEGEEAFHSTHVGAIGDFSYLDEKYNLILYCPSVFSPEPEDADENVKRLPSQHEKMIERDVIMISRY